ncbi:putative exopolyphosphatase [Helianthus annuus]|nr:putative exopolyphosphatase [Helianthus annuus]
MTTVTDPFISPFSDHHHNHLFAAIDLGTNSFKLRIVRANPTTGRFLTIHRLKDPVVLASSTTSAISTTAQTRAIDSLRKFHHILASLAVPPSHLRLVATSAIRESSNQSEFIQLVYETLGFQIDVVSGYEEARLTYLGVLQFHPVYNRTVLTVDIGGGSTEFVVGLKGDVKLGVSLKLGHVTLTQRFVTNNNNNNGILAMREHIRNVVKESGLVEKLCEEESGGREGGGRKGFFKTRSAFIVAAVVLLEEIFGLLGVEEMEVSGYALGEGVIAEKLAEVFDGFDLNANARWRSVLRVASRFNNKKRMSSAAACASVSQEIFTGLRKWNKIDVLLDDKDLEYLEAACLLHNIGLITGKKGYHKRSYHIIMNGEHLHGYNTEEVKLIALLVRHHRKKFLQLDHNSLRDFTDEMKRKFRVLCIIIRLSAILKQYQSLSTQSIQLSHSDEGFKLVFRDSSANNVESMPTDVDVELRKELQHFEKVVEQKLSVVVLSSPSGS